MYERIVLLCEEKKINGKQLGELLDLKKSPLTDWKNGKAKPTVEQIRKLCEIFAVSADYLIFGKTNDLTENEKELLQLFKQLPDREQIKFIGRLEDAANAYTRNTETSSNSKVG